MDRAIEAQVREETRGAVRWIVLDRPGTLNALTLNVVDRVALLCDRAAEDGAVRTVVLAGDGGAFCAGLDLKEARALIGDDFATGMERFHAAIRAVWAIPKPTIAAVDGPAAGFGLDLALACDLRFASPRARLGTRFIRLGLMPDGGGTWQLPRLVGLARAFELIYEGRMVDADEARDMGLVNRVLDGDFAARVQQAAARLAKGPPLAYARAKAAVHAATGTLEKSLGIEGAGQAELVQTADFQEGIAAFLEKREPKFTGR